MRPHLASATITATKWPYFPGSLLALHVHGLSGTYHLSVLGAGDVDAGGSYQVPLNAAPGTAFLVAGNASGIASRRLRIAAPPHPEHPLLVVASYDDGLLIHDAANFSVLGVLATGGVPSDVAVDRLGNAIATDTQGTNLTLATISPWRVSRVDGIVNGDDLAIDETARAVFVTNRDWNGGGLTRVDLDPPHRVARVATGQTAEGIAVDERRRMVYVANANDATIAFVDARSMQVMRRFPAIARVFSLALSADGRRLYAVSNQSADSPFGKPGATIAIALDGNAPRIVARSANLDFPIGVAVDAHSNTVFVSDEQLHNIEVLDAQTLRAKHDALPTCAIPWKLTMDQTTERLYVPCAGDDKIDVFDARTLRRIAGAPFATGGYPLAIAVWPGGKP